MHKNFPKFGPYVIPSQSVLLKICEKFIFIEYQYRIHKSLFLSSVSLKQCFLFIYLFKSISDLREDTNV